MKLYSLVLHCIYELALQFSSYSSLTGFLAVFHIGQECYLFRVLLFAVPFFWTTTSINQGTANDGPEAKYSLLPYFCKVLLEHTYTHFFMYYSWFWTIMAELSRWGPLNLTYLLSGLLVKKCTEFWHKDMVHNSHYPISPQAYTHTHMHTHSLS